MITYFKNLSDALFFSFQQYLVQTVTTNGVVWLIPTERVTELTQFKNQFEMSYGFITNKLTRNPIQVQSYRAVRQEYETFIEELANAYIIFNPLITREQINAMGFNVRSSERTPRPQITSVVFGGLEALPGSQVQFICRTATEMKRASILKDADCVEVRYAIGAAPATVDDCPLVALSTKAKFTLDISPADAGKRIYAYLRWRNNKDVEKSGPWSDSYNTVVRSLIKPDPLICSEAPQLAGLRFFQEIDYVTLVTSAPPMRHDKEMKEVRAKSLLNNAHLKTLTTVV